MSHPEAGIEEFATNQSVTYLDVSCLLGDIVIVEVP